MVKIDQNYYIDHVLEAHLLPHAEIVKDLFCFQQDSEPTEMAKRTFAWMDTNM
jgi:hypothetical protein